MVGFQWVYANGCTWIPLDDQAQSRVEHLWMIGASTGAIYSATFLSVVDINFYEMTLTFNHDILYTIARIECN